MMKISKIFELPSQELKLEDWVLRGDWFPELPDPHRLESSEVLAVLAAEGRLAVKQLVYLYVDGSRDASMHTLWFDGTPVAIVQNAGRSGRDHQRRWVTNGPVFLALEQYLVSKMLSDEDLDVVDPESEVYEEEFLCFYGNDFTAQFGIELEPRRQDVLLLPVTRGVMASYNDDRHYLAQLPENAPEPAEYLRRGAFVLRRVREFSREELEQENPRINMIADANGYERTLLYVLHPRPSGEVFVQPI